MYMHDPREPHWQAIKHVLDISRELLILGLLMGKMKAQLSWATLMQIGEIIKIIANQ
jgi:hypothetical protein